MREFLEDAEAHRGDGYRRAQLAQRDQLPKRFYTDAGARSVDGGFEVTLDGRPTKTPSGLPVVVPSATIATAMAMEWAAQGERIDPGSMPLVRLINSTIESGAEKMAASRDEVVKFAAGDLLLYRADGPERLVTLQEQHWDAALVRIARHFGVAFQPTIGIIHQEQPKSTLDTLAAALDDEPLFPLVALNSLTNLTGSGLLALALRDRLLDPEAVWAAAHVDEDYNIEMWGVVEEATERRAKRRREFEAAVLVLEALRAD